MPILQRTAAGLAGLLLAGCGALQDAPPLDYQCPHDLRFTAHLYQDMAMLDGMRGHAVLERQAADTNGDKPTDPAPLLYADDTVRAEFGLGVRGRLVRLDYTHIPDPVYCTRVVEPGASLPPSPRAVNRNGPRPPPPPPDPDAPVQTNIRTIDGQPVRIN
jgi:hypothetical protein